MCAVVRWVASQDGLAIYSTAGKVVRSTRYTAVAHTRVFAKELFVLYGRP